MIELAVLQRSVSQHHTPFPTAVNGEQPCVIFRSTIFAPLVFYKNKIENIFFFTNQKITLQYKSVPLTVIVSLRVVSNGSPQSAHEKH